MWHLSPTPKVIKQCCTDCEVIKTWWLNGQPYKISKCLVNMSQDLSNKLAAVIVTNVIAGANWTLHGGAPELRGEKLNVLYLDHSSQKPPRISHSVTLPGKMWTNIYPPPDSTPKELFHPSLAWRANASPGLTHTGLDVPPESHPRVGMTPRPVPGDQQRVCSLPWHWILLSSTKGRGLSILWLCELPGSLSFINFLSHVNLLSLGRTVLIWSLNDVCYGEIQ